MTAQHRRAPTRQAARQRKLIVRGLAVAVTALVGLSSWWLMSADGTPAKLPATAPARSAAPAAPTKPPAPATTAVIASLGLTASGPSHLSSGSDPSVMPGPILIADGDGDRVLIIDTRGRTMWQFPRPGVKQIGQTFKAPEAAWFTPNGKQVVVASEDYNTIRVIDIATDKIVYTYGASGIAGSGPNRLDRPDSVLMLPSGDLLAPDAGNCRIVVIPAGGHAVTRQLGKTGTCVHRPPQTFSDPSGLFPMTNGHYLVTEGKGGWVTEMTLAGKVSWSIRVPGVSAIYATTEVGPDLYATADHVSPGQVLTFDHTGKVLWRYAPTGRKALNKPSLVLALPNGDYLVSDKVNNRLIVVDPRTDTVVWQYGHTKVAGSSPGYLNNPTGMDLYPPDSMLVTHAPTMAAATP